uniref:PTTG1 interacting protein n=1 Tax=Equus asinus asinus TaxID=83772 RepID=A0A8C4MDH4_EQUAS
MVLEWGPRPLQPPTGEQTVWLVVEVVEGVGSWAVWSFGVHVAFLTLSIIHLFQCLWCNTNKACLDYPVTKILPPGSLCKLSSARWGVCWVNFEALIITMSVLGGAVLLGVAVCCCCCCRRKKSRKPDKSEEKAMREREERRIRQEERRAEMKSRHDEIRKKYGLFKEENPYARFENN